MKRSAFLCVLLLALTFAISLPLYAGGPGLSGAIFTTLPDGSEVNFNIYSDKTLVYLDGGPPVGAPLEQPASPGLAARSLEPLYREHMFSRLPTRLVRTCSQRTPLVPRIHGGQQRGHQWGYRPLSPCDQY